MQRDLMLKVVKDRLVIDDRDRGAELQRGVYACLRLDGFSRDEITSACWGDYDALSGTLIADGLTHPLTPSTRFLLDHTCKCLMPAPSDPLVGGMNQDTGSERAGGDTTPRPGRS